MLNSPDSYDQNKAFTKHIVDAMMKPFEEKLELEVSIPRKILPQFQNFCLRFVQIEMYQVTFQYYIRPYLDKSKTRNFGTEGVYDEWEPTIKIKIKDYECNLCVIWVLVFPNYLRDVLGFHKFDDCCSNLHLADSTIKKLIRLQRLCNF